MYKIYFENKNLLNKSPKNFQILELNVPNISLKLMDSDFVSFCPINPMPTMIPEGSTSVLFGSEFSHWPTSNSGNFLPKMYLTFHFPMRLK